MTDPRVLLPIAMQAADLAADLIRAGTPGTLTPKGDRDYASEVDFVVERTLRAFLEEHTPEVAFVGEEDGGDGAETARWWTLDPIDGTVNFAHRLPMCAVSLALIEADRPILGVIDLPLLGGRYHACHGRGAYLDGQRIRVSGTTRLADAVVNVADYAVGRNATRKNHARLAMTEQLAHRALRVRMLGSSAIDLAWLAEGRTDASVTLSNNSWDVAAGVVIAREAGAMVFDHLGQDHTIQSKSTIATATAGLADDLCSAIADAGFTSVA